MQHLPASLLYALCAAAGLSHASPAAAPSTCKPPYFVLTGDSTVAVGGGWGDGFLSFLRSPPAGGVNPAKNGATTVSYRASGLWDGALESVRGGSAGGYSPFVTIQFGHNDQKAAAGISLDQFQANLERMVREVEGAGGTPIIITSLTRRTFSGGKVVQNLENERVRAIAAADATGAQYLDLNKASTDYLNAIGDADGRQYDLALGDRTHLNPAAQIVFGRMVADLLLARRPELGQYFSENRTISDAIRAGVFVI